MKLKQLCAALLLPAVLTLPACGASEPEAGLPEPGRIQPVSVPAEVCVGEAPAQTWTLPTAETQLSLWSGEDIALLARTKDGSAALYALPDEDRNGGVLLRWGDTLEEFSWVYATPRSIPPQLWLRDMDADGEDELVVSCYVVSGTGVSVEQLHVVERDADGTLTDQALPWTAAAAALNGLPQVAAAGARTYVMLGYELVDITNTLPENTLPESLRLDDNVCFTPAAGDVGMTVTAGGWLDGEGLPATAVYAADIHGFLICKDGRFVMDELHLDGY